MKYENIFLKGLHFRLATSSFIPSIQRQKISRHACDKLMEIADFQLEALGYGPEYLNALTNEYNSSSDDFVSIDRGNVPDFLMESISSGWQLIRVLLEIILKMNIAVLVLPDLFS